MPLPATIPLPTLVKKKKAHTFHFGGDPEFAVYESGALRNGRSNLPNIELDFGGGKVANIGTDASCFEIRTTFGARWYEDFFSICGSLLQNLVRRKASAGHEGYLIVSDVPRRSNGSEISGGTVHGGHIHLSCEDLNWHHSFEAVVTLPFWLTFQSLICDRDGLRRVERSSYGRWGEIDQSPNTSGGTVMGPTGVRCWRNRWYSGSEQEEHCTRGWEYRSIQQQIGLGDTNKRFREIQAGIIYNIIFSSKRQKEQQERFMRALLARRGFNVESDPFFQSGANLTSGGKTIQQVMDDAQVGRTISRMYQRHFYETIQTPRQTSNMERQLRRLILDMQYIHEHNIKFPGLEWFINALNPDDMWAIDDLNKPYNQEYTRAINIEIPDLGTPFLGGRGAQRRSTVKPRETWTPNTIWNAMDAAYDVHLAPAFRSPWWYRTGARLLPKIPIKYPTSNPTGSLGDEKVCRDEGLYDLLCDSLGMAYYAVTKVLGGKWIQNPGAGSLYFVGCKEAHGSPDTMFFYDESVTPGTQPPFHLIGRGMFSQVLEEEGLGISPLSAVYGSRGVLGAGEMWIKHSMRTEPEYDIPNLLVGSYMLYRMGYMSEDGVDLPVGHYDQFYALKEKEIEVIGEEDDDDEVI